MHKNLNFLYINTYYLFYLGNDTIFGDKSTLYICIIKQSNVSSLSGPMVSRDHVWKYKLNIADLDSENEINY